MCDALLFLGLSMWGDQDLLVCSGEEQVMTPADDDGDGAEAGEEAGAADDGEEAGGDDADVDHYAWIPPDPEDVVAGDELGECCKEAVAEEDPYQRCRNKCVCSVFRAFRIANPYRVFWISVFRVFLHVYYSTDLKHIFREGPGHKYVSLIVGPNFNAIWSMCGWVLWCSGGWVLWDVFCF